MYEGCVEPLIRLPETTLNIFILHNVYLYPLCIYSVRSRVPRLSAQIHSPYEYNTESTRSSYFSRACLTEYKIRYSVTYIVAATSIQLAMVTVDVFLVIIRVLARSVELMSPTRSFVSSLRRFKGEDPFELTDHHSPPFIRDLPHSRALYSLCFAPQ